MTQPNEVKILLAGRRFRAQHRRLPAKQDYKGDFLRSEQLTVDFYTDRGTRPLGQVRFFSMAAGFNQDRCYPADEEALELGLFDKLGAWWADDFKKDATHPVAKKLNLSELLAAWLKSSAPAELFSTGGTVYMCPAPIGSHDESGRIKLLTHYQQHLGAQLVPGANYLAELPCAA